jgi:hypothetical protein
MRQHCEHALLTPRPFGPWEYCKVACLQGSSPCSLSSANVNNASALQTCITYSATLRALGVLQGSLASPVCRVPHPAQSLMQKCQQCVSIASMHYLLHAPSGLGSIAGYPCSPRLQGSSPCSISNAKMSTMRQHCEHALLTPRPFGPWEYFRVALLAPLAG